MNAPFRKKIRDGRNPRLFSCYSELPFKQFRSHFGEFPPDSSLAFANQMRVFVGLFYLFKTMALTFPYFVKDIASDCPCALKAWVSGIFSRLVCQLLFVVSKLSVCKSCSDDANQNNNFQERLVSFCTSFNSEDQFACSVDGCISCCDFRVNTL